MKIFPAIDLYEGKAVRLLRGDYDQMTVYSGEPWRVAADFAACGASCLHLVDLEGARTGATPNLEVIRKIIGTTALFTEVGGGIRSTEVIERYLDAGVSRIILGTAAVTSPGFAAEAVQTFGDRIAVGVDIKDGRVAIRGWTETSALDALEFCAGMEAIGVRTLICTDISRDGAMQGANHALYRTLAERFGMNIIASGGVSSLADVERLAALGIDGAIIGKAYYTGAIDLREALKAAEGAA